MSNRNAASYVVEGTFRDPQGRLYQSDGQVLREIFPDHVDSILAWLNSSLAQRWMKQRRLIPTQVLHAQPGQEALLGHEQVFFPTFQWEWTPGQWKHAASLILDLCEEAIDHGFILKDAPCR